MANVVKQYLLDVHCDLKSKKGLIDKIILSPKDGHLKAFIM